MNSPQPGRSFPRPFAVPGAVAAVSLCGLVAALVGDGVVDVISWMATGAPIVAIAWAFVVRRS